MTPAAGAHTGVKICGVCTPDDARMATSAGASFVGVILAPGFDRTRTLSQAGAIFEAAGDAARVGVFVDATTSQMLHAVDALRLDVLQLHGDESPELLRALHDAGVEVWKAVRVRAAADVTAAASRYADVADALLLDGWSAQTRGGAGVRFDAAAVARVRGDVPVSLRLVVAGGLAPDNVADVVRALRPDVVDVSSGVEEVRGRKSAGRVQAFIAAVRGAEETQ